MAQFITLRTLNVLEFLNLEDSFNAIIRSYFSVIHYGTVPVNPHNKDKIQQLWNNSTRKAVNDNTILSCKILKQ